MHWFSALSLGGLVLVVGAARLLRGRLFATFAFVILSVFTLSSLGMAETFSPWLGVYAFFACTVYVHFLMLTRPRMRGLAYRLLVSLPASWFAAATLLAWPWALLSSLGFHPWVPWLPYVVALGGALDSLLTRQEVVDVSLDGTHVDGLRRIARGEAGPARALQVVQITDPHLGPFMSVGRLRKIAERAVERKPDLVLLTGDFLTMESQGDARYLAEALAPLAALPGRVFACRGNHDLECPDIVAEALARAKVRLLVDESVTVETPAGPVEILGFDFHFRRREEHIARVLAAHPRVEGHLRVALLHDPGAFRHVPDGAADLVLSGHTHGGQVGLLWLGVPGTVLSALTRLPDHGLWASGKNRLYVHRGTGHYGFPLRVGVPAEESLLRVHFAGLLGGGGLPGT
ncbi:MAG TPA: metallophosphoesterase [Polyangiaceae bacterium]|nr:metallophosphoesterase [Polyangiaceae bacterium]